jgi:hypothetical protein
MRLIEWQDNEYLGHLTANVVGFTASSAKDAQKAEEPRRQLEKLKWLETR